MRIQGSPDPVGEVERCVVCQFVIKDDSVLEDVGAGTFFTFGEGSENSVLIDSREGIAKLKVVRIGGVSKRGLDPEAFVLFGPGYETCSGIQVLVVIKQKLQRKTLRAGLDLSIQSCVAVEKVRAEAIKAARP